MKQYLFICILVPLLVFLVSCGTSKDYKIYWDKDNLCVVMPYPTRGIANLNQINWGDVNLDEVAQDIYEEIIKNNSYLNIKVWVRFENPQFDKYGNETMVYDDFEIATIPLSEAKKYQSWKFLNQSYSIIYNIEDAANGVAPIIIEGL